MSLSPYDARRALGCLADCAGVLVEAWHRPRLLRHKGRIDLVTDTDLAIQERLSRELAAVTPGVPIVGEEGASSAGLPDCCWVIDPVDGTTNFVHGIPMVGVTAAYCEEGRPVFGMTTIPLCNETWWASRGLGAFLNGRPARVSQAARLEDAVVATGFPYNVDRTAPEIVARLRGVLVRAQGMRRMGAASVDLVYVASGRMDAYYEGNLKPWDYMAGWLIVEEAGGTVSDDQGRPYEPGAVIVADNGLVHEELLDAMHAGDALLNRS